MDGGDPGWGPALRHWARVFVTFGLGARKGAGLDGLGLFRFVFISLVGAAFLIQVILPFAIEDYGEPRIPALFAVLGLGIYGVGAGLVVAGRPLALGSEERLAGAYRTRFFVGFALAEGALLTAFVFSFVFDEWWPFAWVLPFFLVAMWRLAPSRANIQRDQRRIAERGSPLSLVESLKRTGGPAPRR